MVELLTGLFKIIDSVHSLISLLEAARSNPEITVALSILLFAGAAAAIVIRRTRRTDLLSIR